MSWPASQMNKPAGFALGVAVDAEPFKVATPPRSGLQSELLGFQRRAPVIMADVRTAVGFRLELLSTDVLERVLLLSGEHTALFDTIRACVRFPFRFSFFLDPYIVLYLSQLRERNCIRNQLY